ncbi:MAG: hypothetical protein MRK01_11080 [Candidatus Scalindua sp.]|nr:hypothetical protein [Candidatus Scalindua sp.]
MSNRIFISLWICLLSGHSHPAANGLERYEENRQGAVEEEPETTLLTA